MYDNYINSLNVQGVDNDLHDSGRGEPYGVATLDGTGRIPYSQLPESAIEYKGVWNPATNTPHLVDGTGTLGDTYFASAAGDCDFGSGTPEHFEINDRVMYNGTIWQKLSGGAVASVNGKVGQVILSASDVGALPEDTFIPSKTSEITNDSGFINAEGGMMPSSFYHRSTWNPFDEAYFLGGGSYYNPNISGDTGDVVWWLRNGKHSPGGTELCMAIDGDMYVHTGRNRVLAEGDTIPVIDNNYTSADDLPNTGVGIYKVREYGVGWVSNDGFVIHIPWNDEGTNAFQIAVDDQSNWMAVRSRQSGVWHSWQYLINDCGGTWKPLCTNIFKSGDTYKKVGGAEYNWDSQVCSRETFTSCYVSFTATETNTYRMIGLDSDPNTHADYLQIDYCWYLTGGGVIEIYESGNQMGNFGTYATGDNFYIEYDGAKVNYYHNGTLKRSVNVTFGTRLGLDSSFYSMGGSISNLMFGACGTEQTMRWDDSSQCYYFKHI